MQLLDGAVRRRQLRTASKALSTFAFSLFDNASPSALVNLQTERTEK
jgi:hypothetical protein